MSAQMEKAREEAAARGYIEARFAGEGDVVGGSGLGEVYSKARGPVSETAMSATAGGPFGGRRERCGPR